jgi:hypothetical protein
MRKRLCWLGVIFCLVAPCVTGDVSEASQGAAEICPPVHIDSVGLKYREFHGSWHSGICDETLAPTTC